jgi:hypothetical protein
MFYLTTTRWLTWACLTLSVVAVLTLRVFAWLPKAVEPMVGVTFLTGGLALALEAIDVLVTGKATVRSGVLTRRQPFYWWWVLTMVLAAWIALREGVLRLC